jgi:L-serine dehydratase
VSFSVLDFFTIGIGPSSSHTVGPMRAAKRFLDRIEEAGVVDRVAKIEAHLYGSLALTGKGHGTDRAVLLGLEGETPEGIDIDSVPGRLKRIESEQTLQFRSDRNVRFNRETDLLFHRLESLPEHPNGMRFIARDTTGAELLSRVYYSPGGGFVRAENEESAVGGAGTDFPFTSADELLELTSEQGLSISGVMLQHEARIRPEPETRAALAAIWAAMRKCIERGCRSEGILPGGLKVQRRAPRLFRELSAATLASRQDPLAMMDWVSTWAMAVNEENASGGRVVTSPTNGAAGIVPAVLNYLVETRHADADQIARFLLTAGAIAMLYKRNASISGAEVGCQGEVGVAASMAAAALAEALGGTPRQAENAAEIAMEHHLGLTCDPIGGLVQVPCIERNAVGAVKAIQASRLALHGDGTHRVSLDKVIRTMRDTGADMSTKYKETARGGLAVNVVEC